jgi:PilZ domain
MSTRDNRRTALRHARRMKVPCSMKRIIEQAPFDATVALVTGSAVRLVSPRPFTVGAYLAVDLPGGNTRQLFRVTLTKSQGLCDWVVDGLFSKKLEPRHVSAAQARLAIAGGGRTTCRAVHVRHEGPWLATMHNVSRSGIGLISDRPFDPGTFLEIALPSIRRKHLQPKLIRVTHAEPLKDGDDWMLGGVFLRALTDQELQVLL